MKTDITPADSVCPIFLEPVDPAQVAIDAAADAARADAIATQATAKQAVLDRLGITADEVAALLS